MQQQDYTFTVGSKGFFQSLGRSKEEKKRVTVAQVVLIIVGFALACLLFLGPPLAVVVPTVSLGQLTRPANQFLPGFQNHTVDWMWSGKPFDGLPVAEGATAAQCASPNVPCIASSAIEDQAMWRSKGATPIMDKLFKTNRVVRQHKNLGTTFNASVLVNARLCGLINPLYTINPWQTINGKQYVATKLCGACSGTSTSRCFPPNVQGATNADLVYEWTEVTAGTNYTLRLDGRSAKDPTVWLASQTGPIDTSTRNPLTTHPGYNTNPPGSFVTNLLGAIGLFLLFAALYLPKAVSVRMAKHQPHPPACCGYFSIVAGFLCLIVAIAVTPTDVGVSQVVDSNEFGMAETWKWGLSGFNDIDSLAGVQVNGFNATLVDRAMGDSDFLSRIRFTFAFYEVFGSLWSAEVNHTLSDFGNDKIMDYTVVVRPGATPDTAQTMTFKAKPFRTLDGKQQIAESLCVMIGSEKQLGETYSVNSTYGTYGCTDASFKANATEVIPDRWIDFKAGQTSTMVEVRGAMDPVLFLKHSDSIDAIRPRFVNNPILGELAAAQLAVLLGYGLFLGLLALGFIFLVSAPSCGLKQMAAIGDQMQAAQLAGRPAPFQHGQRNE